MDTDIRYVVPDEQTAAVEWNTVTNKSFSNVLKKWNATVTKSDASTGTAQGDASLAGAEYGVYKGDQLIDTYTIGSDEGEHWLMLTASYYNLRYVGVVNELLKMLEETKDYHNIHKYAAQALVIEPGNMKAYYWLIFAMCQMGATEIAQSEFEMAKQHLTEEEYEELIDALKKMPIDTHRGHFQGLECR